MALRLDLKPYEGFLINGALIRNGSRRADFLIETASTFLRESEVIKDSDADTPAKMLCVSLQMIYLVDDPAEAEDLFARQATEILSMMPTMAPLLLAIHDEIAEKRLYRALKLGRELVRHERLLLDAQSRSENVARSAPIRHDSGAAS